jgi:hypothetical protein
MNFIKYSLSLKVFLVGVSLATIWSAGSTFVDGQPQLSAVAWNLWYFHFARITGFLYPIVRTPDIWNLPMDLAVLFSSILVSVLTYKFVKLAVNKNQKSWINSTTIAFSLFVVNTLGYDAYLYFTNTGTGYPMGNSWPRILNSLLLAFSFFATYLTVKTVKNGSFRVSNKHLRRNLLLICVITLGAISFQLFEFFKPGQTEYDRSVFFATISRFEILNSLELTLSLAVAAQILQAVLKSRKSLD